MRIWLALSLLIHVSLAWVLFARLSVPRRIPVDAPIVLNLVTTAPPREAHQEVVPEPEPPAPEPQPQPEPPKPEPPKPEPPKPEPPKPEPPKPQEVEPPRPVVREQADLQKLLEERIRKQMEQRERERQRPQPTPTPLRLAQTVPTVAPVQSPRPVRTTPPSQQSREHETGPVSIQGPAGIHQYDYYLAAIRNTLWRNWTVPQIPNVQGLLTIADITILRDGRVSSHTIRRRSGNQIYDQSVIDAIMASRFPPFADDYRENQLTVTVRFRPEG